MVVLVDGADGALVAFSPSTTDRWRSHLLAARYDRRLADGVAPEHDICLALRASHLVRAQTRRSLAEALARLLEEASNPPQGAPSILSSACRRRIMECSSEFNDVIEELARPAPVSCRGVATLFTMLRDGTGPLYGHATAAELRTRLREAYGQLLPLSIW
jgi:hypothetical protein